MDAATPRSPSQTSPYGGYGHGPYAHPSTYPSPARTEGDASNNYPSDSIVLYNNYPSMSLPSHSVHPAQTIYPLSPHPTEAAWTPSLATSASPGMMDGQRTRGWAEHYDYTTPQWEQSLAYAGYPRHSPALSEPLIASQRSSVSSTYDHSSLYSQDESDSPWVKVESHSEWMSDEDSVLVRQPMTVSPERLGHSGPVMTQRYSPPLSASIHATSLILQTWELRHSTVMVSTPAPRVRGHAAQRQERMPTMSARYVASYSSEAITTRRTWRPMTPSANTPTSARPRAAERNSCGGLTRFDTCKV